MLHTCSLQEEEAKLIAWLVYEMMNDCPDDSADININFISSFGTAITKGKTPVPVCSGSELAFIPVLLKIGTEK